MYNHFLLRKYAHVEYFGTEVSIRYMFKIVFYNFQNNKEPTNLSLKAKKRFSGFIE